MTTGFAIANTTAGRALNMGVFESGAYAWMQAAYINNADTTFALALQPRGGNVGIGTTSPSSLLTVAGDSALAWSSAVTHLRVSRSGSLARLQNYDGGNVAPIVLNWEGGNVLIGTSTDNGAKLRVVGGVIDFSGDTRYGVARVYNASIGDMFGMEQVSSAQTGAGVAATRIFTGNSTGNYLSLGWYTNATTFVDGLKITATGGAALFVSSVTATGFFESSDKTIKTLIEDNYQTKGIESVTAKLYLKNGVEELGYFAQDLQGILPSAVTTGENGLLNLSYREVHTAKIARLEKEVEMLKSQLNLL
jgi:hypothetical protein